ncbi:MAG: TetR/AcrR family transcriptional regulator [Caulobacteraceae bacterium]|nr:TetR/AcrR family transcriptional regulator [Caulobacteraceae bacterium]
MTLSFIDHLETALRETPPKQKGQRTRERLKIATAKVLEQRGYHAMRVSDITASAEVAEGSFYMYFKDKTDASITVLTEFLHSFLNLEVKTAGHRSAFDAIRATNRRWLSVCRANAGLMRCILQVGDEEPAFARLSQHANRTWYERVVQGLSRRRGGADAEPTFLAAYLLGGMMDELVRRLIIYPDPELHQLAAAMDADDDAMADAAAVIWLRVFYPEERPPEGLPTAAASLAAWISPPA